MEPLGFEVFVDADGARRRRLVDRDGRGVVLRGFNLSASAKRPESRGLPFSVGLARDLVARASDFLPALASDGFDLLRVPIVWEHVEANPGALDATRALVAYAGSLGFRALIDLHQDLAGSYFRDIDPAKAASWFGDGLPLRVIQRAYGSAEVPREWDDEPVPGLPLWDEWAINYERNATLGRVLEGLARAADDFRDFARSLARAFGDLDNVLAFEVLNEPYSKHVPASVHVALARAVREGLGDVVKSDRTPALAVMPAGDWLVDASPFPTLATRADAIRARTSLPPGSLRDAIDACAWIVTPHTYDPRAGTPPLTPWPLAEPEPHKYDASVAASEAVWSDWAAVPIVGEFGVGANKAERDRCHATWIDAFEARGLSWCHWSFNPDAGPDGDDHWCGERFSVATTTDEGVRTTPAYRALLRPFPRRWGGPIRAPRWNGSVFRARVERAYARGLRTEIHVPSSLGAFEAIGARVDGRTVIVDSDDGAVDVEIDVTG